MSSDLLLVGSVPLDTAEGRRHPRSRPIPGLHAVDLQRDRRLLCGSRRPGQGDRRNDRGTAERDGDHRQSHPHEELAIQVGSRDREPLRRAAARAGGPRAGARRPGGCASRQPRSAARSPRTWRSASIPASAPRRLAEPQSRRSHGYGPAPQRRMQCEWTAGRLRALPDDEIRGRTVLPPTRRTGGRRRSCLRRSDPP